MPDLTARNIIKREHQLIDKGIPEETAHKILKKEFDYESDNVLDYDFAKDFKKIVKGKNGGE